MYFIYWEKNHLQNTWLGYYYDLHTCFGFRGWWDCDLLLRGPPDAWIPISYTFFCLWPSHNFFFIRFFVFLSVRTNAVYFAFFLDAFPWQGFGREEYRFSLPPAQSFSTRKNRSYLFDFQCLMRYIVLWKYSFMSPICSL